MTCFNPLDKFYKSKIGAISANQKITFRVKGDFNSVLLLLNKDGENDVNYKLQNKGDFFEVTLQIGVGLYFYCFLVDNAKFIGLGNNYVGELTQEPKRFQLTVYSSQYQVPTWLYGGIIYQIFPDRFYCYDKNKKIDDGKILHENWGGTPYFEPNQQGKVLNNDFFGGDLKGITSKLSYIKQLGVTAIYLNPIFKAYSNHRYDTGDYMSIDNLLGDENDLIELIDKSNSLGIKIILDGVFNHTGDDSVYFNKYGNYNSLGAYQSKDSKYAGWYNFTKYPNQYESWWGITTLPSVNETNSDFVNFVSGKDGVIEKYTKLGVCGWRLDVVDELPSAFVQSIRTAAKRINQNAIVIGEVWEDASNKISYGVRREYFQGKELDSVMNYPLKNAIINFVLTGDVKVLSLTIKQQLDHYPSIVLHSLMNMLSTHDTFRLISAVGGEDMSGKTKAYMAQSFIPQQFIEQAKFRVKVATLMQFTLCGVPSIYYGDEVGMQGYADPLNRKCYPWGNEDFELLNWYKYLGKLRGDYDAFVDGEFEEIYAFGGAFVYVRKGKTSEILVAINLSDKILEIEFDQPLFDIINECEYKNKRNLGINEYAVFVKK